ncbi:MAG TPA: hypothetical protein PK156_47085, partial [Polyangium sp.]|nr:hypothetical protein [Polyangium sp.]
AGAIDGAPDAAPIFLGWLKLVEEAVGLGYVRLGIVAAEDKLAFPPENLMELLLLVLLPGKLGACAPQGRVALLAKAWNLGEGLLAEPPWLNLVVASAMSNVASLMDLEGRLLRILDTALAPRARSAFQGPYGVRTLDLRDVDGAFLPGRMHFAEPALVCIHDRKRPDIVAGVLIGAKTAPSLAFRSPCLAEKTIGDPGLPTVSLTQAGICVGDARVPLPLWTRGHAVVASRAGLIVASALDSQRIWIAETP